MLKLRLPIADRDREMTHAALKHSENGGQEVASVPERQALGTMLIERDFLTDAQLAEALEEGAAKGERLGEVVVRRGWIGEDDLAKVLAEQWKLGYLDRTSIWFDGKALARITREDAQRLEALPTSVQEGRVVIALAEPTEQRLNALNEIMGEEAVFVVVAKSALDAGLKSDLLTKSASISVHPEEEPVSAEPSTWVTNDEPDTVLAAVETDEVENDVEIDAVDSDPGDLDSELALESTIAAVEAALDDASTLQTSAGELAGRLAEMKDDLVSASARLSASASARAEDQAEIARLQQQLSQRTEVGESLKSQLASLSETLESFSS